MNPKIKLLLLLLVPCIYNIAIAKIPADSLPEPLAFNDTLIIETGQTITWDQIKAPNETYIAIDSGAMLIIKDTVYVKPETKIVIKRGARLELDNGAIIGLCMWKGIEVWGTKSLPPTTVGAHGVVLMKNGSLIENAMYGIRTIKTSIDQTEGETLDYNHSGGHVIVRGSSMFKNCKYGVQFFPYGYDYTGNFRDVIFEVDDELINPGEYPVAGVWLDNVEGVEFLGCEFKNTRSAGEVAQDKRGVGIYSFNSNYTVLPRCTSQIEPCPAKYKDPNRFESLYYGIRALNSGSVKTFVIDSAEFIDNVRGVYAGAVDNLSVTRSLFEMGTLFTGELGIYLDECTGYIVEENEFYQDVQDALGIVVNKSGSEPNEIYRNRFYSTKFGILAQNENRAIDGTGLQIKCNEFIENSYDLAVTSEYNPTIKKAGIAKFQGSPDILANAPAGNRFSWNGSTGIPTDINNQAQHVTYYYHYLLNDIWHLKPKYYTESTVNPIPNLDAPWIPDESCSSNFDTTGIVPPSEETMKDMMAITGQKADSVGQLIQALEDAGDTEDLKWEVDVSIPAQSLQVYSELMGASPYVSDSVMASAIEKETVMVDAMIRDVMVANPESAKDDGLLQKLGERTNPLPDYMLGQILQGRSLVSVYGDLLAKQSFYKQQNTNVKNRLKRLYLTDTLNQGASLDSLALLLEKENTPVAKYGLAFLYARQGYWGFGQNVLDNIPQQFTLSTEELDNHQSMETYFSLFQQMNGNSPDSLQTLELFQLVSQPEGRAAVYARNTLIAMGEAVYNEPIIYPDMQKSAEAEEAYQRLTNMANDKKHIHVFPNPAGDYIIVKWNLERPAESLLIRITDNTGKPVMDVNTTGTRGQQVIDTHQLEAGVYVVSFFADNKLLDSEKVSVGK